MRLGASSRILRPDGARSSGRSRWTTGAQPIELPSDEAPIQPDLPEGVQSDT